MCGPSGVGIGLCDTRLVANVTLLADVYGVVESGLPAASTAFTIRPSTPSDLDEIGALYFRSYKAGEACTTEQEAVADVAASFEGDYGEYLYAASPVALSGSTIVAAVMTVKQAPWSDTPTCPFVIELFTDPEHRRSGLATALLATAANAVTKITRSIALRVEEQNSSAIAVYNKLGFRPWNGPDHT